MDSWPHGEVKPVLNTYQALEAGQIVFEPIVHWVNLFHSLEEFM
jgi:hypothetical protein